MLNECDVYHKISLSHKVDNQREWEDRMMSSILNLFINANDYYEKTDD